MTIENEKRLHAGFICSVLLKLLGMHIMLMHVTSTTEYYLSTGCNLVLLLWVLFSNRPGDPPGPITLRANEKITLTCDTSAEASDTVLPVSCGSFKGYNLQPGSSVFVGQYLFTGSERGSASLLIEEVCGSISVAQPYFVLYLGLISDCRLMK